MECHIHEAAILTMALVKQGTAKGRKVKLADDTPEGISLEPESMEESIRVCTRMRPLFPKEVRYLLYRGA